MIAAVHGGNGTLEVLFVVSHPPGIPGYPADEDTAVG